MLGAYGPLWGLAIIVGKALTGYTCGLIGGRVRPYLTVAVSYVPEFIFSVVFYTTVGTRLAPDIMTPELVSDILFKGWVEILILSFILNTIVRREMLEAAIVLLEIFIVTLLGHKEHTHTLALLLGIVFVIMLTVDVVRERIRVEEPGGKDA